MEGRETGSCPSPPVGEVGVGFGTQTGAPLGIPGVPTAHCHQGLDAGGPTKTEGIREDRRVQDPASGSGPGPSDMVAGHLS